MWDVPFEALHRASVLYAPSLSALREMRKRRPVRVFNATLVVFGDPTLTKEVVERVQTTYNGLSIAETAATTRDIEAFKSKYRLTRVHAYSDVNAKKDRLKVEASTAGVVHFAAPVILDNAVPMYSFVALTPDPDLHDDGMLRLSEIANLNSAARVVVLPHIFRANSQSGNALIALSWSWFVAGTPGVMVGNSMYIGK